MEGDKMARSRNIKPGFFTNDALAELPPLTRILFAGLWTIADREGRLEDRPKKIKAELLPYDDVDVNAALDALTSGPDPFIIRYAANGVSCIQIMSWHAHQRPHVNEKESSLPPISEASTTKVVHENNQGSRVEVKGIRNQESGIKEEGIRNQGVELDGVTDETVRDAAGRWLKYKAELRQSYKPQALQALVTRLNNLTADHSPESVVDAIDRAMANGWKGFDHDIGKPARGSPKHKPAEFIPTAQLMAQSKPQ